MIISYFVTSGAPSTSCDYRTAQLESGEPNLEDLLNMNMVGKTNCKVGGMLIHDYPWSWPHFNPYQTMISRGLVITKILRQFAQWQDFVAHAMNIFEIPWCLMEKLCASKSPVRSTVQWKDFADFFQALELIPQFFWVSLGLFCFLGFKKHIDLDKL